MIASATAEVNRRLPALPKGHPVNDTCEGARVGVERLLSGGREWGQLRCRCHSGLRVHGATLCSPTLSNNKVGGWRPPT